MPSHRGNAALDSHGAVVVVRALGRKIMTEQYNLKWRMTNSLHAASTSLELQSLEISIRRG